MAKVQLLGNNGPNYVELTRYDDYLPPPIITFPLNKEEQAALDAAKALLIEGKYEEAKAVFAAAFNNAHLRIIPTNS